MTIYSILQTSSNSELSPDVLDNSYKDYSKAVRRQKVPLNFHKATMMMRLKSIPSRTIKARLRVLSYGRQGKITG